MIRLSAACIVVASLGCGGAGGTRTDAADVHGVHDVGEAAALGDVVPADKRCGTPETYFSAYSTADIVKLSDCTILVGRFQQDSVTQLEDFAGLEKVRKIEGWLNVFRSGFLSLRGFDNLEVIEGNLSIHQNWKLNSLSALGKLHTITGDLYIMNNDRLSQAEVDAFAARVTVGGTKTVRPMNAP
jgi:hypothetical protein